MVSSLATGGMLDASATTIVTSAYSASSPSLAVARRTYVPRAVNVARVDAAAGSAKLTVPGPLVLVHATLVVEPTGSPSSLTSAAREANPPSVATCGAVTETWGGWLP